MTRGFWALWVLGYFHSILLAALESVRLCLFVASTFCVLFVAFSVCINIFCTPWHGQIFCWIVLLGFLWSPTPGYTERVLLMTCQRDSEFGLSLSIFRQRYGLASSASPPLLSWVDPGSESQLWIWKSAKSTEVQWSHRGVASAMAAGSWSTPFPPL